MVIVEVRSGLGNQMFQYAFYLSLKERKNNVKIDLSFYDTRFSHNGYELDSIFGIDGKIASNQESLKLGDINSGLLSRARRKIFYIKETHYIEKGKKFSDNKKIFKMDNVYLSGYWQTEKYFYDIENTIRSTFIFKRDIDEYNANIVSEMRKKESVSMHVRRGDYQYNRKVFKRFGGICNLDYYEKALKFMRQDWKNRCSMFFPMIRNELEKI